MSAYLWHANASTWFTPKFMVQFTQNRQNGPTFGIGNRHFLAGESECQHTLACGPIVFNFSELKASLFCDISKPNWYKGVRLTAITVPQRPGDYQTGDEASVGVKAIYETPDGINVSSAEETLTCSVGE